jgi:starch-binding outer membrane protein, SusD/RagB family
MILNKKYSWFTDSSTYRKFLFICVMLFAELLFSCNKLVEVQGPYTSINADNIYENDAAAISSITSIYAKMSSGGLTGGTFRPLSLYCGLSADEYSLFNGIYDPTLSGYYINKLTSANTISFDFWYNSYPIIYNANIGIEGLDKSKGVSAEVKKQLLGESYFVRALFYFYLTNLYGDVPLALTSDYTQNIYLPRIASDQVYKQCISDLNNAKRFLSENYLDNTLLGVTSERVRPTKWVASALLSRIYLYTGDYLNASLEADTLINNPLFAIQDSINKVFLKSDREAIWQLQPVDNGINTAEARFFVLPNTGPSISYPVYLNSELANSFQSDDKRKINWVGKISLNGIDYYYPYKYKVSNLNEPVTEYTSVFRLSELYLIRAEARAQLGSLTGENGALSDLNVIRNRAAIGDYNGIVDRVPVLDAILEERRHELFSEFGHRWLDLKRTGNVDEVMSVEATKKGGVWNSFASLYPIKLEELKSSPNVKQNPGY